MEPLIAEPAANNAAWKTYTPGVDEYLQNHAPTEVVQVVQGALSVATDPELGSLVDLQGTKLRHFDGLKVIAGTAVNYRTYGPGAKRAGIGRNPA